MTREKAIQLFHEITYGTDRSSRFESDRAWATKAIEGFEKLGMLKLDEPESADERATRKAVAALDKRGWSRGFFSVLDDAGLKIVEKD